MKKLVVVVLFVLAIYVTWNLAKMDAESAKMPTYEWTGTGQEWVCAKMSDTQKPTIRAMVDSKGELGRVEVIPLDVTHEGVYHVDGLEHRWDWDFDPADGHYHWSFTIGTDGRGLLFDFGIADERGVATSKETFTCKEVQVAQGTSAG